MEQIEHFCHDHLLSLVHLQADHDKKENSDDSDEEDEDDKEEEGEDDFVVEDHHHQVGQCYMCEEQIYTFHLYYYECKDCDYLLHQFCAKLPTTLQTHPLHPSPCHNHLTLSKGYQNTANDLDKSPDYEWMCAVCNMTRKNFFNYHCSLCLFDMDIVCATMYQQKVDHPSHPHPLQLMVKPMSSYCNACGTMQSGTFYHCTTCSWYWIHMDCALLPTKLLIQQPANEIFTHSHPLTLAYSFPQVERRGNFYPGCRVCGIGFHIFLWIYKCDKCRYYAHISCAMSLHLSAGHGKTHRNFKDEDHPNLIHCPFPDGSYNLVKHHYLNQKDLKNTNDENDGERSDHSTYHQHPLILFNTQTSQGNKLVSLHNPMERKQLLCDGCVKPITTTPFYKCSEYVGGCGFVLHEWCAKLPSMVQDYPGHPEHTLVLLPNVTSELFGVFICEICLFPSNGFAYGCTMCEYYVDINCAFMPNEITHEAHPNHLLSKINASPYLSKTYCNGCLHSLINVPAFRCHSCDFNVHVTCALLLPREIKHRYDKHALILRYFPVENHISRYFCEVCEDEFNPNIWFYHCTTCGYSMHAACTPLILECEQAVYAHYDRCVFQFLNVKFGGTLEIRGHPHQVTFVQGIGSHGRCSKCCKALQYKMIFKCLECDFALHYQCV